MSILSESQAKAILDKVIAFSTADSTIATLGGGIQGNVRFARNDISTAGVVDDIELGVQVAFGKRVGTASINQFDDASLERVVRRAEDLAKLAPENPEFVAPVGQQTYRPTETFSAATAALTAEARAKIAEASILPCRERGLIAAGFLEDGHTFFAHANSNGNFGYQQSTIADYTCTVRTEDGRGSGWVGTNVQNIETFDAAKDVQIAMRKAAASVDAQALEPGKYTVILEPAAAAGLISFMMNFFDARAADEGRSFLSKQGGGHKIGEQIMGPRGNIYTGPWPPPCPAPPWGGDGLPREKTAIIEGGKVANLEYSRYWAQKQGKPEKAGWGNVIMEGGSKSTADLIAGTERGILLTRTWYIRMVDPQTVLLTGLTRDGTFYIENGQLKYPIKNFRFNESPVIMLNNIEELGRAVRVKADEGGSMLLPPMKIRDFTFTSLSDAV
ncbi:MAG: TldD/PmbA family protein [Porphyrobacter sp.]|nr:TldD/PmbA family protein [Porphyrobacter sp.]